MSKLIDELKQQIQDDAHDGLAMYERLPESLKAYEEARCVAKAIGHTCSVCHEHADILAGIKKIKARMEAAQALLKLL